MVHDVSRHVKRCRTCHSAKGHAQNMGLYTPFPVPNAPWEDVNIDFVVGFLKTQRNKDSIMVVVDQFLKMAHFVPCLKTLDASHAVELYFKEIVELHSIPKTITSDHDTNSMSQFLLDFMEEACNYTSIGFFPSSTNRWVNRVCQSKLV